MAKHDDSVRQELHDLLKTCLEAARVEVARRLKAQGRPLSIEAQRLLIIDNPQGGWSSQFTFDRVSGLYSTEALLMIRDTSVRNLILGLREQLSPVAEYLIEHTDIATRRYHQLLGQDPIDGLLFRCISPLALYYLTSLTSLARPRPSLVNKMADELYFLATSDVAQHVYHLTVGGVQPKSMLKHRDVSIRPLTPRERGAWAVMNMSLGQDHPIGDSDYKPSAPFPVTIPSTLIEITSTRPAGQAVDNSTLANKLALAFYLLGYEIGSSGVISHFDRPTWGSMGRVTTLFPVSERVGLVNQQITQHKFDQVVKFSYKMPDFSSAEANAHEIVLWRVLRGCGMHWHDSAFIDFAIALEAALLGQRGSELSYRFSLYGSLFLRTELDPVETFTRLKEVYTVRSKLVHGGSVKADKRHRASQDAAELAKAITLKAIESGWPDADALDALAVSS